MTIIPDKIKNLNIEKMDFNDHDSIRNLITLLLNVIESQSQIIEELRKENQSLKDEINRLKGEKEKLVKDSKKAHHKDRSDRN